MSALLASRATGLTLEDLLAEAMTRLGPHAWWALPLAALVLLGLPALGWAARYGRARPVDGSTRRSSDSASSV